MYVGGRYSTQQTYDLTVQRTRNRDVILLYRMTQRLVPNLPSPFTLIGFIRNPKNTGKKFYAKINEVVVMERRCCQRYNLYDVTKAR